MHLQKGEERCTCSCQHGSMRCSCEAASLLSGLCCRLLSACAVYLEEDMNTSPCPFHHL